MTKSKFALALILFAIFTISGCNSGKESRWLFVSETVHFGVQPGSGSLNLPFFAGTLGIDNIVHEVSQAEYYHEKFTSVYGEKSFQFLADSTIELLLDQPGPLAKPQSVYAYTSKVAQIDLDLISFDGKVANYSFRVIDRESGQVRTHQVEVPEGQSASIGLLFDPEQNRGYLIAVSVQALEITNDLTPEKFAEFLRAKNTPRGVMTPSGFRAADQKWMNELFGARAITLGTKSEQEESQPFDIPPMPVGGMNALASRLSYPESALRDTLEGRVLVVVKVDTSGNVSSCEIARSVRADLDSVVLEVVRDMKFTPAVYQEKPVATTVMIPIDFRLN
jgi:TonB family protein